MIRLLSVWNNIKTSFWFVPILFIMVAVGGAMGTIALDSAFDLQPQGALQHILPSSVDSARSVLSTISGAMIGVAGTVFSITLVALTLASSQFGPRLLRNFMTDRTNQVVLGSYISTFVYSLMVLNAIEGGEGIEFVPKLSVLFAILAAVANIILLIIFIHHIAMSIQADKVISDVSSTLSSHVDRYFPEDITEEDRAAEDIDVSKVKEGYKERSYITSPKDGYLQYVDYDAVLNVAKEEDSLIVIRFRPGDHLVLGSIFMDVFSNQKLSDGSLLSLQEKWIVGRARTPYQDPEFSIHQMVEIALRALSPGINDPYTAITCIDNLTSTMCTLTNVRFPPHHRYDEEDRLRVVADTLTFEGMLNAAFNQIRQFSGGSPSVVIRLMESLVTINQFVKNDEQKEDVRKHARMVLRLAERTFTEENDLLDLKERSRKIFGSEV